MPALRRAGVRGKMPWDGVKGVEHPPSSAAGPHTAKLAIPSGECIVRMGGTAGPRARRPGVCNPAKVPVRHGLVIAPSAPAPKSGMGSAVPPLPRLLRRAQIASGTYAVPGCCQWWIGKGLGGRLRPACVGNEAEQQTPSRVAFHGGRWGGDAR